MEAGAASAAAAASSQEPSRKRPQQEDDAGPGQSGQPLLPARADVQERPAKRRRLGQASVLCMRELFRAIIRDGDISEAERLVLQNAAVLLSQLKGDQWVHFPDTQGEVKEFQGSKQQRQALRDFLEKVGEELQAVETKVEGERQEGLDCLKLAAVPWAGAISTRELLACCMPQAELEYAGPSRLLELATKPLPTQYMVKSRVRELINFYYLRRHKSGELNEPKGPSKGRSRCGHRLLWRLRPMVLAPTRAAAAALALLVRGARRCLLGLTWAVSQAVVALTTAALAAASCASQALCGRRAQAAAPLWPTLRFLLMAFLHGRIMRLLEFVVLMARFRVVLCLASCHQFFGTLFYPFVFIAEKFLRWNEESWLLGCACENNLRPSLLSWVPVRLSDLAVWLLKLAKHLPMPDWLAEEVEAAVDAARPVLFFFLDLAFCFGFAEGLAKLVESANANSQPRLVMMSMNIGRMLRESPLSSSPALLPGEPPAAAVSACGPGRHGGLGEDEKEEVGPPPPVPQWCEDGAWSLFDTS